MDRFLKCPWCGDEIARGADEASQFDCPACGGRIDVGKAETTAPAPIARPWTSKLNDGTVVTHVGSCAGTTEAVNHVRAVLASGGIWVRTEGSKAYTIFVREADAQYAKELLRGDPQREYFHVTVYPD